MFVDVGSPNQWTHDSSEQEHSQESKNYLHKEAMLESVTFLASRIGSFCLLLGVLHAPSLLAIDSGYIEAVKADVSEFSTKEFIAPVDSSWLGSGDEAAAAELNDLPGFSSYLKNKSPGSYIFYTKLPTDYQERLHRDYLATGDLDRIKQDIFKYTREAKK